MAGRESSVAHRAAILRRERELEAELFQPPTHEEKMAIAKALDRADPRCTPRLLDALPDPQLDLLGNGA